MSHHTPPRPPLVYDAFRPSPTRRPPPSFATSQPPLSTVCLSCHHFPCPPFFSVFFFASPTPSSIFFRLPPWFPLLSTAGAAPVRFLFSPTPFYVSLFFLPRSFARATGCAGPPVLGVGGGDSGVGGMGNLLSVLWSQISGVREVKVRTRIQRRRDLWGRDRCRGGGESEGGMLRQRGPRGCTTSSG